MYDSRGWARRIVLRITVDLITAHCAAHAAVNAARG